MKKTGHLTGRFAGGALALAMAMLTMQASADNVPQVVQVLKVRGSARYSTDNKTWQKLNEGDVLEPGAVIQTATHSIVDIEMTDRANAAVTGYKSVSDTGNASPYAPPASGAAYTPEEPKANVVRIFESSVLAVDKLDVNRTSADEVADTQLDLRAGHILGNVKKLSASSKYEIKIPNGVAGIRGSMYSLWATGELHMLSGSSILAIVGADGTVKTFLVMAGYGFNPSQGAIFQLANGGQAEIPLDLDTNPNRHHGRGPPFPVPPYGPPPISPVR